MTVTSDTTLTTTSDVVIAGTLQIAQGANLTINSGGAFNLSGEITGAPGAKSVAAAKAEKPGARVTRSDPALTGAYTLTVYSSVVSSADGMIDLSNLVSYNIYWATNSGFISMKAGSGSTSSESKLQIGGSVVIGLGDTAIGQTVEAGNGAAGLAGTPVSQNGSIAIVASPGGDGGSIVCKGKLTATTVTAGNGGKGGSCKYNASPGVASGTGIGGTALLVQNGTGGKGGSISLGAGSTVQTSVAGAGGVPGDVAVTAQNGAPGGNGGDVTVNGGATGAAGTGGQTTAPTPSPATLDVFSGNGGTSTDTTHDGGRGGDIHVHNASGQNALSDPNYQIGLAPGSGGSGFSPGCGAEKPGTNGGRGGDVLTYGTSYTLALKSDGGDGGSGDTASGNAGPAGTSDTPVGTIGTAGQAGQPCTKGATFTTQAQITGGLMTGSVTAGSTNSITLVNVNNPGQTATFSNVYCPDNVSDADVLIVKAGAMLMNGHYTSTLAQYLYGTQPQTVPLTSSGALKYDTLIETGAYITLPIDQINESTFPNGVQVQMYNLGWGSIGSVQTLSFSGSGTPVASVGKSNNFSGTGSLTGGQNAAAEIAVSFQGANISKDFLTAQGSGQLGAATSFPVTGQWQDATATTYYRAVFIYDVID